MWLHQVLEKTFETKLDNRFNELLARLPPPAAPAAPLQQQQQQQRLPPLREIALRRASRVLLQPGQTVGVGERSNFKKFPTHTQDHGDA